MRLRVIQGGQSAAARDVEVHPEELERRLRAREVTLHDLVDDGSGWQSIADCAALADVCAELQAAQRWRAVAQAIAGIVLIAAVVGYLLLAFGCPAQLVRPSPGPSALETAVPKGLR